MMPTTIEEAIFELAKIKGRGNPQKRVDVEFELRQLRKVRSR